MVTNYSTTHYHNPKDCVLHRNLYADGGGGLRRGSLNRVTANTADFRGPRLLKNPTDLYTLLTMSIN